MTSAQEFALTAARKYLQSVVFVDDEIYVPVREATEDVKVGDIGPRRMQVYAKVMQPSEPADHAARPADDEKAVKTVDPAGGLYHPKQLVESFARQRMVCALYEPSRNFDTDPESEIFKLCERADAVILDWDFHGEPGKKVIELLGHLMTAAQTTVPHHVRLCAVYTSTPNLQHVASQLYDTLKQQGLDIKTDGPFDLNAGSSRIIVLGKPSTTGRPADQNKAEVKEVDLADRIITEFARMHEGILPSMALHGLASVRTNTKKILDKFRKDMDGAFLTHRGLIYPGDDAFEQIPELLAEEALAVMIDTSISLTDATKIAEDAIDAMTIRTAWVTKAKAATKPGEYPIKLLKEGPVHVRKEIELNPKQLKDLHDELDPGKAFAAQRLAALYASRTQYGKDRYLDFGTIVRYAKPVEGKPDEIRYAICLMPLCDCVRLKPGAWYQFPFWDLRPSVGKGQGKGIVVELPAKEGFVELFSLGKPRDQLWLDDFQAGDQRMVTAGGGKDFAFTGKSRDPQWIAQLKPAHAQRIAQDIGTSFARVGVIEAEWLRLKADRQD
ncbi:response regulator receiver domain [Mesorhizobium sp. M0243]|uniref:response regulator receiver domain n=1 Tax=Mesorhizobium sp. M0243 TaxID=2956925 RepID=UPI00333AAE44